VLGKIVDGAINGVPLAELPHLLNQERRVEGVRVIKIFTGALFQGKMRIVLVIMILREDRNTFRRQSGNDPLRDSRLSGPSASSNPDDQPFRHDRFSKALAAENSLSASRRS